MNKTENNLYQRILSVYKKVTSVIKEAEIEQGNNSYQVVTHDTVTKALHIPVAEAGIVCWPTMKSCVVTSFEKEKEYQGKKQIQTWYRADVVAQVKFINADNPQDVLESEIHSYAFDTSDKAIGKAYSMAIKNIYLKTFMLESLDQEEARPLEDGSYKEIKRPVNHAPTKANGISEAQAKKLFAMGSGLGWSKEDFVKFVKDHTSKTNSKDLTYDEFMTLKIKLDQEAQSMGAKIT